jgi:multiple sugar transport system permease protein
MLTQARSQDYGLAIRAASRIMRRTPSKAREALYGYLFLTPWVLGLLIFLVGPMIASLYYSLTSYNVLRPPEFIGLANFRRALFEDDLFWPSLGRTFRYAFYSVPLGMVGSLALALLLNQNLWGTSSFRTMFFLPYVTPVVATAILFQWLFHTQLGPVNVGLSAIGIKGPGWLTDKDWALPTLVLIALWGSLGGNRMMVFLAGLQGVPESLYEAAELDGAGALRKFVNITLPMISPTLFFNLVLGIIGALKVFAMSFIATQGGPNYATWFYALHIYRHAFQYFEMGYSSCLAWMFAIVLFTFTLLQVRLSNRWVFYAGE